LDPIEEEQLAKDFANSPILESEGPDKMDFVPASSEEKGDPDYRVNFSEDAVHPLTVCTGGLLSQSGCRLQGLVLGKMAQ
jgi:hypothetical protein